MASPTDDRHQHLEELVCCNMHDQAPVIQFLNSCDFAAKRSGVSAQRESVARRTPAASEALVRIRSFMFE